MPDQDIVKPSVQAFLVCDTIIVDQLTGKKSLIGTFTHLWAPQFPCQHPQMGVYFCFTDAEGTYEFELRLIFLDEDKVIGKASLSPITIQRITKVLIPPSNSPVSTPHLIPATIPLRFNPSRSDAPELNLNQNPRARYANN